MNAGESGVAISVSQLSWQYEGAKDWTLKDISFKVRRQEALGVVGQSGAGKTTLILALTGIIPQRLPGRFKGTVQIEDKLTHRDYISEIVRYVGAVFQDPDNQFTSMSVLDEIVFGLENIGLSQEEMRRRVEEVARFAQIEDILSKHPYEISGGQKQRVAIASALALRPEILLLDEPTTDLDPVGRAEVFRLVGDLKRAGQTMVIVEHESDELAKVADEMILLDQGRIVLEAPARQFYSNVPEVTRYGVAPPQPTELFYELNGSGELPLTLEEGVTALKRLSLDHERLRKNLGKLASRPPLAGKGEALIEVNDVAYRYPDGTPALDGVTFTIQQGDYIALVGQNGSGKTTLAKLLNGLLKPTRGSVRIRGHDTRQKSTAELARIVGYCFQNPDHQLFERTVYDEVALGPRETGLPLDEVARRTEEAIHVMGLNGFEKEHPFFLGKGQRLRLAVATILALNSEVLLIDEPTTGQDWKHSKDMMNYLDLLNRKEGKTIVIITHHMRYVAEHANRVLVMADGKMVLDAPTRQAFSRTKELLAASVRPPAVSRLFLESGLAEANLIPLSVEEARDALRASMK